VALISDPRRPDQQPIEKETGTVPIKNRLAELMPEIAGWRREIHMHPELGYDLPKTTALVEEKLREFGVDDVVTGVGRSGIVAVIRGKTDTRGYTVGLRADMDALPMTEMTDLPHASTIPGRMHGCGHDGHTAMLLGAAKYLAETRNFDGTAVMIFQPAEEGGGGGEAMVKDGLMERFGIDEVYGMHNEPGLPVGEFGVSPGPIMAAADEFEVRIVGKGGHAARPHMCIDPCPAACNVVLALQTVASRNTDPIERIVVSVCTIKTSSEAHNVIPPEVLLKGTVRTLSDEVRDMAERRVTRLIHSTAEAYDCEAHVELHARLPGRGQPRRQCRDGRRDRARRRRRGQGPLGPSAAHGRRGFRLHAERAARGLHQRRQRRYGRRASPDVRL
jgi:amidohydrolase